MQLAQVGGVSAGSVALCWHVLTGTHTCCSSMLPARRCRLVPPTHVVCGHLTVTSPLPPSPHHTLQSRLREGEWVHIFPEGTRSRDGRMLPVRKGVGWLVATAAAAGGEPPLVLPFVHGGMERILPKGSSLPKLGVCVWASGGVGQGMGWRIRDAGLPADWGARAPLRISLLMCCSGRVLLRLGPPPAAAGVVASPWNLPAVWAVTS